MRFSGDVLVIDDDLPELWDTLVYCIFDVRLTQNLYHLATCSKCFNTFWIDCSLTPL